MSWSGPCSERYDAHPAESPGRNTNNARKCGHAFCKECLRKSQKKPRPCLSCGTVPTPYAKAGGEECYNHDMNQFQQLLRKYCKGPSLTAKGNKRVRKPGDDEFGLQPRLARPRATKKPAGGARKGRKKSRGSRRGAKKNGTIKRIQTNASSFLRECDKKPWSPIPHSAKTAAALGLVKKW